MGGGGGGVVVGYLEKYILQANARTKKNSCKAKLQVKSPCSFDDIKMLHYFSTTGKKK